MTTYVVQLKSLSLIWRLSKKVDFTLANIIEFLDTWRQLLLKNTAGK